MWDSFNTAGPVTVNAELTTFPGGNGDEIHAYIARPAGPGPFPGIVLAHHMPGFDEFHQEMAERLARHGYEVICPDLYCRSGHGTPGDVGAAVRSAGGGYDELAVADLIAAHAWLKSRPDHNGKVGVIGFCSGGRLSVLVASRTNGFDAVVDCWGGGVVMAPEQISPQRPVAPIDLTESLSGPLLGLFGNDDKAPTPEQVDQHEAELKKYNKEYEFHRYDGAGHGFIYYHVPPLYRAEQAMDGWGKIFAFFSEHLAS